MEQRVASSIAFAPDSASTVAYPATRSASATVCLTAESSSTTKTFAVATPIRPGTTVAREYRLASPSRAVHMVLTSSLSRQRDIRARLGINDKEYFLNMKAKHLIISSAVTLALLAPAGTALASTDENASTATAADTSTTVPATKTSVKSTQFRASMQAWQEATRSWLSGRAAAMQSHREAIATASSALKNALETSTTKEGRRAAMSAFKSARDAAKSALDAALAALGERPVRPTR